MGNANSIILFRDIPGFPGYRADSEGNLWSSCHESQTKKISRGERTPSKKPANIWRKLKSSPSTGGYLKVSLFSDSKRKTMPVHIAVLLAFIGPKPKGYEARHFPDIDKTNNSIDNLSWGTRVQNAHDKILQGAHIQGEDHGAAKLTEDDVRLIRSEFASGKSYKAELARKYNVSKVMIGLIISRKKWKHLI